MEVKVYVRNLSRSMTQADLVVLFEQAGDVTAVQIVRDRNTGDSKGYAFITMSAQNEADRAVSMFNAYALDENFLTVKLVRPREQRGLDRMD